jgi:hypothetical protein
MPAIGPARSVRPTAFYIGSELFALLTLVRSIRLGFLGSGPFGHENPCLWRLEKLGFPWTLSSELSFFNGLHGILAKRNFSRPLAATAAAPGRGVSAFIVQKRSIAHGVSLTQFLLF